MSLLYTGLAHQIFQISCTSYYVHFCWPWPSYISSVTIVAATNNSSFILPIILISFCSCCLPFIFRALLIIYRLKATFCKQVRSNKNENVPAIFPPPLTPPHNNNTNSIHNPTNLLHNPPHPPLESSHFHHPIPKQCNFHFTRQYLALHNKCRLWNIK